MFDKLEEDSFRRIVDIHLMGTFHCSQAALPFLPEDGRGRIINVTSSAGLVGTLGQVNYSAAKAGIIGFTKSLARELARRQILVNALAPLAATPMTETIRTNEKFAAPMLARIPLAAGRRPRRSRVPSSSSPRTPRRSSPGRCCRWTGAWSCDGRAEMSCDRPHGSVLNGPAEVEPPTRGLNPCRAPDIPPVTRASTW